MAWHINRYSLQSIPKYILELVYVLFHLLANGVCMARVFMKENENNADQMNKTNSRTQMEKEIMEENTFVHASLYIFNCRCRSGRSYACAGHRNNSHRKPRKTMECMSKMVHFILYMQVMCSECHGIWIHFEMDKS